MTDDEHVSSGVDAIFSAMNSDGMTSWVMFVTAIRGQLIGEGWQPGTAEQMVVELFRGINNGTTGGQDE